MQKCHARCESLAKGVRTRTSLAVFCPFSTNLSLRKACESLPFATFWETFATNQGVAGGFRFRLYFFFYGNVYFFGIIFIWRIHAGFFHVPCPLWLFSWHGCLFFFAVAMAAISSTAAAIAAARASFPGVAWCVEVSHSVTVIHTVWCMAAWLVAGAT